MTTPSLTQEQLAEARRNEQIAFVRKTFSRTVTYVLMSLLGFVFLFPIIFMVVAAFKENSRVIADLSSYKAFLPDPSTLTFENITGVFDRVPFEKYTLTSLIIAVFTVIGGLFINSMAAFVLARLRWFGRKSMLAIIISLVIIPLEAIAIPLLIQVNEMTTPLNVVVTGIIALLVVLMWSIVWNTTGSSFARQTWYNNLHQYGQYAVRGLVAVIISLPLEILLYFLIQQVREGAGSWFDSYHVQIVPFLADPFSIFLFYQFFIGIPKDFDEAATVDGAGYFRIYWDVIVPLARPVFATVAILQFLRFWAFYMWPLLVIRDDSYRPLMVGMDFFRTQSPILWGQIMAYAAMVTIPVLIVFLLFQSWFVRSVSSSGVKG
jgi:multiple sugar transport system permease protein